MAETTEFHRAVIVTIDITEANPFTGGCLGHENETIEAKENTDEDAYQWAPIQLVGITVPIVLDVRPV